MFRQRLLTRMQTEGVQGKPSAPLRTYCLEHDGWGTTFPLAGNAFLLIPTHIHTQPRLIPTISALAHILSSGYPQRRVGYPHSYPQKGESSGSFPHKKADGHRHPHGCQIFSWTNQSSSSRSLSALSLVPAISISFASSAWSSTGTNSSTSSPFSSVEGTTFMM